jgi:hypothetical protein
MTNTWHIVEITEADGTRSYLGAALSRETVVVNQQGFEYLRGWPCRIVPMQLHVVAR